MSGYKIRIGDLVFYKNMRIVGFFFFCVFIIMIGYSAASDNESKKNKGRMTVTIDDGKKIKDALIHFLEMSQNREYKVLLRDIESSVPRIGDDGSLRIGSWEYNKDSKKLMYRPVPQGWGTSWYYVEMENEKGEWKVKEIDRMEIFR